MCRLQWCGLRPWRLMFTCAGSLLHDMGHPERQKRRGSQQSEKRKARWTQSRARRRIPTSRQACLTAAWMHRHRPMGVADLRQSGLSPPPLSSPHCLSALAWTGLASCACTCNLGSVDRTKVSGWVNKKAGTRDDKTGEKVKSRVGLQGPIFKPVASPRLERP